MKGKFILYAVLVCLGTSALNWAQFIASASNASRSYGSNWTSRTGTGSGTWGNGTGGTSGSNGHK